MSHENSPKSLKYCAHVVHARSIKRESQHESRVKSGKVSMRRREPYDKEQSNATIEQRKADRNRLFNVPVVQFRGFRLKKFSLCRWKEWKEFFRANESANLIKSA